MLLGWPQTILLFMMVLRLGVAFAKHGEKEPAYNGWTSLFSFVFVSALLYFGGFFR